MSAADSPGIVDAVAAATPSDADVETALGYLIDKAADALEPAYDYIALRYTILNRPAAVGIAADFASTASSYPDIADQINSAAAAIRAVAGSSPIISDKDSYENRRAQLRELAEYFRGMAATGKAGTVTPADAPANADIQAQRDKFNADQIAKAKADARNPLRLFTGETNLTDYLGALGIPENLIFWAKVAAITVPVVGGVVAAAYVWRAFR